MRNVVVLLAFMKHVGQVFGIILLQPLTRAVDFTVVLVVLLWVVGGTNDVWLCYDVVMV